MSQGPRTRKRARASVSDDQNDVPQAPDISRSHIVMIYLGRRVIVPRPMSYQLAAQCAGVEFNLKPPYEPKFSTNELPFLDGEMSEISIASWKDIITLVSRLFISTLPMTPPPSPNPPRRAELYGAEMPSGFSSAIIENGTAAAGAEKLSLDIRLPDGTMLKGVARPTTLIKTIRRVVAGHLGICEEEIRITFDCFTMRLETSLSDHGCEDGDTLDVHTLQVGGKPVIYLFPPSTNSIEAKVSLRLSSAWSFSTVYPVAPVKALTLHDGVGGRGGEEISWSVLAKDDGTLRDHRTSCDVSYLFWEAETNPKDIDSPPASPIIEGLPAPAMFDPRTCTLTPNDSVLVSIDAIPAYLDKVLTALELHVEARTSFITYWLPSLLKHKFVALRFVPQQQYEQAARLDITPSPDVILRIFMIFQGIDLTSSNIEDWQEGVSRAEEEPAFWRSVVGLGQPSMSDTSKFRVLEWGGMEVKK